MLILVLFFTAIVYAFAGIIYWLVETDKDDGYYSHYSGPQRPIPMLIIVFIMWLVYDMIRTIFKIAFWPIDLAFC